jgi:hypothetical protein
VDLWLDCHRTRLFEPENECRFDAAPELFFPCIDMRIEKHKPDRASFLGKSAQ